MATLKIERRESKEEIDDFYNPEIHHGYGMIIIFSDGTHLEFGYVVPKEYKGEAESKFTIAVDEFIASHQQGERAGFGCIWHDYRATVPIWTDKGMINLFLHDSRTNPTLKLSPELAEQLLSELKRIS